MDSENVKAIIASVHLDQVLYDLVKRKSAYTRTPMVVGYLEDFFAYTMSQRMEMMFVPLDNTKLPEQLGKVIITTMLQQTLVDRCRTIMTTYPCEYMTEVDKTNCRSTPYTPCFSKDNPPPGYGYGQWEMMRSFEEILSYRRSYLPGVTSHHSLFKSSRLYVEGRRGHHWERDFPKDVEVNVDHLLRQCPVDLVEDRSADQVLQVTTF